MPPKKTSVMEVATKNETLTAENSHETFSIDPDLINILQNNIIDNLKNDDNSIINQHKNNTEIDISCLKMEEFISLVLKERKVSFKELTVDSLQEPEEEAFEDDNEDVDMEDDNIIETTKENGYEKLTIEQFETLKKESFNAIGSAINESSLLLEVISLLLSGPKPKQGSMTMSPYLKEHLPMGSVNSDKVLMKQILDNDTVKNYLIKMAWKLKTIKNIEEYNEYNFNKLNEQMLIENKYWSIIADSKLSQKGTLIKNYNNNTLGVKYGVNSNQFASLNIVNQKVEQFEVQVIPNIASHRILYTNKEEGLSDDAIIFKYLSVEVSDGENVSKSTIPESILSIVSKAIKPNELSAQLERLNELQFQELIFKTLKLECKNANILNKSFNLKEENTIEVLTNGKQKITIQFKNLLKSELLELNQSKLDDASLPNNILEFIKKNLLFLNKLRCFNNVTNPPIYYSKKRTINPQSENYANIIHNLLLKINHEHIVKLVTSTISEYESLDLVASKNELIKQNQKWKSEELDNANLKKLKMELNSYSALTELCETTFEVSSKEKNENFKFKLKLTTPNSYSLELLTSKSVMFDNISELLDYITFI